MHSTAIPPRRFFSFAAGWAIAMSVALAGMVAPAATAADLTPERGCPAGFASRIAGSLGHRATELHLDACRPSPSDSGKSIVALLYPSADSDRQANSNGEEIDYDLDILTVHSGSGKKLAGLHLDQRYFSDAVRYASLTLDTGRYNLTPGLRAFGVRAKRVSPSRVASSTETSLDLFVEEGKKIRSVLSSLVVQYTMHDWDTLCAGISVQTERSIAIAPTTSHGYADLTVASKTIHSESKMIKGECREIAGKTRTVETTLHYDGKAYRIPSDMREMK